MPHFELDLKPVSHISADAIGAPGKRVFYLQGWQENRPQPVTLIVEKFQLQTLAISVEKLTQELQEKHPDLGKVQADYNPELMRILPPVDPIFRVGEIGLGYEQESDLVVILAKEIISDELEDLESASIVRFWCTRAQARSLAMWSQEVIQKGRPICPQCGQPMEVEGHFCPKKNGHKH